MWKVAWADGTREPEKNRNLEYRAIELRVTGLTRTHCCCRNSGHLRNPGNATAGTSHALSH